jgi:uncharacterized protein (TIGR02996 family)
VNLQDAFLKALAAKEDDTATRLVYADWLDEQGQHEEADRQRKWPAANQWLRRLGEESSNPDSGDSPFPYENLIAFGQQVVTTEGSSISVYDDTLAMGQAILGDFQEFFQNWSVVTGIPLPPHLEAKTFYWECCPTERHWIGGAVPPKDEEADSDEREELDRVQDDLAQDSTRHRGKKRKR